MKPPADELMEIGILAGTHGLRGDMKVRPLPTGELALSAGCDVFLRDPAGRLTPCHIQRCAPHKQFLLVHFDNIHDIDAARSLVGQSLLMRREDLPELPDGRHFWCDLDGLLVVDRRRGTLGRVEEMFATAAHDILVVRGAGGEVLIPAIPPFVCEIDLAAGEVRVDLPDGLVPFLDEV
jgi:16S rRNA processing protein RimM